MFMPRSTLRHSLSIYGRLLSIQVRSQMQYRLSFLMDVTTAALVSLMEFGSLALVLQRFGTIGGWRLGEVAFLYGMVEAAFGLMDMLFSGFDPHDFGEQVRRGTFDQVLLRPVSPTVQVLGSRFWMRRLGRILQGGAIFTLALLAADIAWTPLKLLYLPLVFLGLVAFFGALFVVGSTVTFWTVQTVEATNLFTYGGSTLMSYPMHIFDRWLRRIVTYIVPAIFLSYYPALFFLDRPELRDLPAAAPFLAPLVGGGALLLALRFWHLGIRHYQSTGS